jgi:type III restriction enzyme
MIKEYAEEQQGLLFGQEMEFSQRLDGKRILNKYWPEREDVGEQELPEENLLRYAIKMATGSGKTMVMAFVIVWSYFNRLLEKDRRFADNFLIIAPNVIVYERLAKDFADAKLFYQFPFIPSAWKHLWNPTIKMRGDESPLSSSGNIIVNNIHQLYESRIKEWKPESIIEAFLGRTPQKDPTKPPQVLLERIKELDNIIVLNDEAHHVHDDELKWNEALLSIHNSIPGGLTMWLDFTATPKTPNNTYYPWIICDYPLAQAVEDRIVKVPLIIHGFEKHDPEGINKSNVVVKYGAWIKAALIRWKDHFDTFKKVKKKPVLFIMAEKNDYADKIAEAVKKISDSEKLGIKSDEILIIHTDSSGEIKKGDLESLREEARDIDKPENKIKVIVSVLMLREGWDVQNVTLVLGLRAFDSPILPEQAIGRGLRLMRDLSPDRTQTLEIIGNNKFEEIIKQLEDEGVGITTTKTPPPLPITIAPEIKRLDYDITIPATDFSYNRTYKKLEEIDVTNIPSLFTSSKLKDDIKTVLKMTMFQIDYEIHQTVIDDEFLELGRDLLSHITREVMRKARLTDCFHILYPKVEQYILNVCFESKLTNIENENLRKELKDISIREIIIDHLAAAIGKATVEKKTIKVMGKPIKLSNTPPFTWRRKREKLAKTVFNFVALYNDFEGEFAKFLNKYEDITAFAALAGTDFKIDYLTSKGAIRFYYPDFVAIQKVGKQKVFWILETKGREFPELDNKNKAVERWCDQVSKQTGKEWKYLMVKQLKFTGASKNVISFLDFLNKYHTDEGIFFET